MLPTNLIRAAVDESGALGTRSTPGTVCKAMGGNRTRGAGYDHVSRGLGDGPVPLGYDR